MILCYWSMRATNFYWSSRLFRWRSPHLKTSVAVRDVSTEYSICFLQINVESVGKFEPAPISSESEISDQFPQLLQSRTPSKTSGRLCQARGESANSIPVRKAGHKCNRAHQTAPVSRNHPQTTACVTYHQSSPVAPLASLLGGRTAAITR